MTRPCERIIWATGEQPAWMLGRPPGSFARAGTARWWADGRRIARLSIGLVTVLLVAAFEPTGPRDTARPSTLPAAVLPRLGEACWLVQRYPVNFARDATGTWEASFAIAGGATTGHVPLPGIDSRTLAESEAYVADVRFGSYEPADAANERRSVICRLQPTYHFYCLSAAAVDQFCLTWVRYPVDPILP